ncbi:MAG: InlB B-repeat-containing protein, partial [Coriobacteriales bacterium]|nr:InlB B-repeat-containing protein [Coriobacteriales bacterium]
MVVQVGKVSGKASASVKNAFDSELGRLAAPKRTGHTFQGWYTKKSGGTKVAASPCAARPTRRNSAPNPAFRIFFPPDPLTGGGGGGGGRKGGGQIVGKAPPRENPGPGARGWGNA